MYEHISELAGDGQYQYATALAAIAQAEALARIAEALERLSSPSDSLNNIYIEAHEERLDMHTLRMDALEGTIQALQVRTDPQPDYPPPTVAFDSLRAKFGALVMDLQDCPRCGKRGGMQIVHDCNATSLEDSLRAENVRLQAALVKLPAIVEQLRACDYTCDDGPLEDNVAFMRLEQLTQE